MYMLRLGHRQPVRQLKKAGIVVRKRCKQRLQIHISGAKVRNVVKVEVMKSPAPSHQTVVPPQIMTVERSIFL
jgi:hypothetical protein